MPFPHFCRACCCGSRDDSSDDDSQSQHSDHAPSCPLGAPPSSPTGDNGSLAQLSRPVDIPSASSSQGSGEERDPPLSDEEAIRRGRQMIEWIDYPTDTIPPCPVSDDSLTYEQIQAQSCTMTRHETAVPEGGPDPYELKLPEGEEAPRTYINRLTAFGSQEYVAFGKDHYNLFFAPGLIGMFHIVRQADSDSPHCGDVALTLYNYEFGGLVDLRHVFAITVVNGQTVPIINEDMNARSMAEYGQPGLLDSFTYVYGTPEYERFLGARIPRTVGFMVLKAYPRGTHRITRVEVYAPARFSYDLRFDIEPID